MCKRLLAVLLLASTLPSFAQHPDDFFPMSKGTYWLYSGTIKWTLVNSNHTREKHIEWKMQIIDSFDNGKLQAALIKGHPSDLDWYDEGITPGQYLLVRKGRSFYFLDDDDAKIFHELFRGLWSPDPHDIFFELPLDRGERFCDSDERQRPDAHYCWVVDEKTQVQLTARGVSPGTRNQYRLVFFTNPDHVLNYVVPGVGITRYVYDHHGTLADVDVKLVGFTAEHPRIRTNL